VEVVEYDEQHWDGLNKFFRMTKLGFAREPDGIRWNYSPAV
jgi:hypothetical protein